MFYFCLGCPSLFLKLDAPIMKINLSLIWWWRTCNWCWIWHTRMSTFKVNLENKILIRNVKAEKGEPLTPIIDFFLGIWLEEREAIFTLIRVYHTEFIIVYVNKCKTSICYPFIKRDFFLMKGARCWVSGQSLLNVWNLFWGLQMMRQKFFLK